MTQRTALATCLALLLAWTAALDMGCARNGPAPPPVPEVEI